MVAQEIQAEREMLVQKTLQTATAKSAALCTALIKNQIVLITSSLGPFPWKRVGPVCYSEHDCFALAGFLCLT